jgi:hypothetical protein
LEADREQRRYERDLTGLMLRFLSPRRVPTVEHFEEVVQRCLSDLARALAHAERERPGLVTRRSLARRRE